MAGEEYKPHLDRRQFDRVAVPVEMRAAAGSPNRRHKEVAQAAAMVLEVSAGEGERTHLLAHLPAGREEVEVDSREDSSIGSAVRNGQSGLSDYCYHAVDIVASSKSNRVFADET